MQEFRQSESDRILNRMTAAEASRVGAKAAVFLKDYLGKAKTAVYKSRKRYAILQVWNGKKKVIRKSDISERERENGAKNL